MMNLFHFIGKDTQEQAAMIIYGKYLASRQEEQCDVFLYCMGEYYAEVFYHTGKQQISRIKGFKSRSMLLPYLDTIKLPGLYNKSI